MLEEKANYNRKQEGGMVKKGKRHSFDALRREMLPFKSLMLIKKIEKEKKRPIPTAIRSYKV